jgi:hypothetical protein
MPFLDIGPFHGTLVILDHSAAQYRYSPALEMYQLWDARLDVFATYLDVHTFVSVFSENFEKALQSRRPIISMPYTPIMAKVLQTCLHKYFSDCLDNWLCVAFFHDDKDTASLTLATGDNPLDYKIMLLKDLLNYPYIKKIEIPRNLLLTYPSVYSLIETVV